MERKPRIYSLVTDIAGYRTYHIEACNKEEAAKRVHEYLEFMRVTGCYNCALHQGLRRFNGCETLRDKTSLEIVEEDINDEGFDASQINDISEEYEEYAECEGNIDKHESKYKQ